MNKREFVKIRHHLGKTQAELAHLLGVSVKAVQSCEQGWRRVPMHAERQLLLLLALEHCRAGKNSPCWLKKCCPIENKEHCPAWEFDAGDLCLVINGTRCDGTAQESWGRKMQICRKCEIFASVISSAETVPDKA